MFGFKKLLAVTAVAAAMQVPRCVLIASRELILCTVSGSCEALVTVTATETVTSVVPGPTGPVAIPPGPSYPPPPLASSVEVPPAPPASSASVAPPGPSADPSASVPASSAEPASSAASATESSSTTEALSSTALETYLSASHTPSQVSTAGGAMATPLLGLGSLVAAMAALA
ncbi:hypothetical protein ACEQ8H_005287 [Pleosporales sp. CAS-2024a]